MSEWRETEIGEFADLINGFAFKSDDFNASKLSDNYLPILKIKNVANGDANFNDVVYHEYSDKLKKYVIKNNDILIALTGNHPIDKTQVVGGISRYKYNVDALLNQRVGKLISKNKAKLDEDFLYYFFKWNKTQYYLGNQSSGSASQANISKTDVLSCPISIPYITEQQEIAKTLSNLDQKITLLRQQNQDLEELAQTLFKRWYVEFEFPNENGEPYKSSGGKMVESELGEIPEGWKVATLSSIANFLNGLACQKYPVEDENAKLPVLKIKELGSGISENSDWATSNVDPKYIVQNGDVIFSWSGTLMLKIWDGDDCVLNQHLFKVTSQQFPQWFIYQWTGIHLQHFISVAKSKATTMGHIKRSHLDEALCLIPSDKVLTHCNGVFDSMFVSFVNNNKEIRTLTKLRDTLLPKLMSGELRVNSK